MGVANTQVTKEHVDQFHQEGYLVIPGVFNQDEVEQMREEADKILELIVNSSLANDRKSGRLDLAESGEREQMVRKIQPINDLSLHLFEIAKDDRLLDPMRVIMEDEPIMMEEKLNYKEPLSEPVKKLEADRATSGFPVHNDWAYFKTQDYPRGILSSAITIDECTTDNGPLHVWPGTHKKHIKHEEIENGLEIPPDEIDHDGGEDVLAPPGSVMFFHSLLVHNSQSNESGSPRRLMIYSHFPKETKMGFDVRNGPTRLRESPYEWEYQRMKDRGEFDDQFTAPSFSSQ